MSSLDLNPDHLAMVRECLLAYVPDAEVWAYGSRTTGNSHEASDLDLVLRNPNDLMARQENLWELKEAFSEGDLPIMVDVLGLGTAPRQFPRKHPPAPRNDSTCAPRGHESPCRRRKLEKAHG